MTLRLRPREWPWCAGPPDAPPATNCRQRDGRPLHALACTRRLRRVAKLFTQSKCYGTSARQCQRPTREGSRRPHCHALGRRNSRDTGPRAAARPEPLLVPRNTASKRAGAQPRPMEERRSADTRSCERAASGTPPHKPFGSGSSTEKRRQTRMRALLAGNGGKGIP